MPKASVPTGAEHRTNSEAYQNNHMNPFKMFSNKIQGGFQKSWIKLEGEIFDAEMNGVKVQVTGRKNLKSLELPDELMNLKNKNLLKKSIMKSINQALREAEMEAMKEIKKSGDDAIPGFSKLF